MKNKKLNRGLLIYILVFALFIIYLSLSNRVFTSIIDGKHTLHKSGKTIESIENLSSDHEVIFLGFRDARFCDVDRVRLFVEASVFCESIPEDEFERDIKMLLVGSTGVYATQTISYNMIDAYNLMIEQNYMVPVNLCCATTFSTLLLPDGNYEVYFFVRETSEISGLSSQVALLTKEKDDIQFVVTV